VPGAGGIRLGGIQERRFTEPDLRRLLGLSRYQLDGFPKAHDVWIDYTVEDLRQEMQDLKRLGF
jgi:hypothetical protein